MLDEVRNAFTSKVCAKSNYRAHQARGRDLLTVGSVLWAGD